jgi:tryptophanyl-tRNA synthetase
MRDIAERFNARYGEELVVPEGVIPTVGARIMDLQDPTKKMSTTGGSEEGTVYVLDEPKAIEKKIKRAVTDSGSEIRAAEDKPGVTNLLEILAAARGTTVAEAEASLADARGYGDLKAATAEAVIDLLDPVRRRYEELRSDEGELEKLLAGGADKARAIATDVMVDVRRVMGVGPAR